MIDTNPRHFDRRHWDRFDTETTGRYEISVCVNGSTSFDATIFEESFGGMTLACPSSVVLAPGRKIRLYQFGKKQNAIVRRMYTDDSGQKLLCVELLRKSF